MASLNEVRLIGNLGKDPEVRELGGTPNCTISVATTRFRKGENGREEVTQWHRVVLWGQLAEYAGRYLKKGAPVYVGGYLETRKWTDNDGQDHYTTEVVAEDLQGFGARRPAEG